MHDELTRVDIRKMQEEIDYRKSEITPKLKEQLKAARDLGDLSENDEYHSVKRALNKNYGRIRYLQAMIDTAVVIDTDSASDVVGLFDKITIFDEEENEESCQEISSGSAEAENAEDCEPDVIAEDIILPPVEDFSGDIDEDTIVVMEDSLPMKYSLPEKNSKDSLTPDRLQRSIVNEHPEALHEVQKNNPVVEEIADLFNGMVIDIHR